MPSIRGCITALGLVVAALTAAPPALVLAGDDLPGIELLTTQEQVEYRQRMRGMASAGEQDQIRHRYEALIRQRAKAQGVTLPGQPQASPGPAPGGKGPDSGGASQ